MSCIQRDAAILVIVLALAYTMGCRGLDFPSTDSGAHELPRSCASDADCDDGIFCNGVETCEGGSCREGTPRCDTPLPGCRAPACDEEHKYCVEPECVVDADCGDDQVCSACECQLTAPCEPGPDPQDECCTNADCDDGLFCNGVELCRDRACQDGKPPCESLTLCDETTDMCGPCSVDADCTDGIDCTDDFCVAGVCQASPNDAYCPVEAPFCLGHDVDTGVWGETFACRGCCNPCLSQCELYWSKCPERSIDEFPDFQTAREELAHEVGEWIDRSGEWVCTDSVTLVAAGECTNERIFLYRTIGEGLKVQFFDASTGVFVGMTTTTDSGDPWCGGRSYWPSLIECTDSILTEVLCGTYADVGDEARLP